MVRALKLAQKDLKYPLEVLLSNLGVVHNDRAYTGYVFFSEDDLVEIRRNHRKALRKALPRARKADLDAQTEQYFQQFTTNDTLSNVVRPGYVLIDFDGMGRSIAQLEKEEMDAQTALEEVVEQPESFLDKVRNFFKTNFGEPQRS